MIMSICTYFITYFLSIFSFIKANEGYEKNNRLKIWLGAFWGILIPCLLASVRSFSVGTDVTVYAWKTFARALNSGSFTSFYGVSGNDIEFINQLVAYIIAQVTRSFHIYLFVLELLVILPVYICAVKCRKSAKIQHTMFFFMFFFYLVSFNIMRQCISASFLLLAICYWNEKKAVKSLTLIFISVLFHNTAIIGIVFWIIVAQTLRGSFNLKKVLTFVFLFSIFLALVFNWEIITNWLVYDIKILNVRYLYYLEKFGITGSKKDSDSYFFVIAFSGWVDFTLRIIRALIPFLIVGIRRYGMGESTKLYFGLTTISTISFIAVFTLMHSTYGYRITLHSEFAYILLFSQMMSGKKISADKIPIRDMIFILFAIGFWIIEFFIFKAHGVVPYEFFLQ